MDQRDPHGRSSSIEVLINRNRASMQIPVPLGLGAELEESLARIRHDLRDAVGLIQNTIYLLQEEADSLSEKGRTYMDLLARQAQKLQAVLETARLEHLLNRDGS